MSNKYMKYLNQFITDPKYRFFFLEHYGFLNLVNDEKFIKRKFYLLMGKQLDLENPKTMNEKLQWLKLYNRIPKYTQLVDKYLVRDFVSDKIGSQYLIPLLGVWNDPEQIDFSMLPQQFVLKCNHNSGLGMCICKDKSKLNINKTKEALKNGLKQNYYLTGREWPYKNIKRKIIAEKYITDTNVQTGDDAGLTDYKFFCFDGKADCVMACIERNSGEPKFYFFDKNWELCRYNIRGKNAPLNFCLPRPSHLEKMFEIAETLSAGIPFVRVDLYNSNGKIYFGEMTFFPDSGFDDNLLPEADQYFGELINLEAIKNKMTFCQREYK